MPVQSTYEIAHGAAFDGAVVDGQLKNIFSAAAAVTPIPFGRFVALATAGPTGPASVRLPTSSSDVTLVGSGFSVRVQDDVADSLDVLQNEIGDDVSVLDFGVIYVKVESNVVAYSPVFVRYAAGAGGSELGIARADADTATAAQVPGARFLSSGAAGDFVPVSIRL